jgi:hypothetical protein
MNSRQDIIRVEAPFAAACPARGAGPPPVRRGRRPLPRRQGHLEPAAAPRDHLAVLPLIAELDLDFAAGDVDLAGPPQYQAVRITHARGVANAESSGLLRGERPLMRELTVVAAVRPDAQHVHPGADRAGDEHALGNLLARPGGGREVHPRHDPVHAAGFIVARPRLRRIELPNCDDIVAHRTRARRALLQRRTPRGQQQRARQKRPAGRIQ